MSDLLIHYHLWNTWDALHWTRAVFAEMMMLLVLKTDRWVQKYAHWKIRLLFTCQHFDDTVKTEDNSPQDVVTISHVKLNHKATEQFQRYNNLYGKTLQAINVRPLPGLSDIQPRKTCTNLTVTPFTGINGCTTLKSSFNRVMRGILYLSDDQTLAGPPKEWSRAQRMRHHFCSRIDQTTPTQFRRTVAHAFMVRHKLNIHIGLNASKPLDFQSFWPSLSWYHCREHHGLTRRKIISPIVISNFLTPVPKQSAHLCTALLKSLITRGFDTTSQQVRRRRIAQSPWAKSSRRYALACIAWGEGADNHR